ncbi:MAG: hypothetical protein HYR56_10495 [Acidobacteria bacterium]|nr:hypothetical protein [Acidobacteriota bacterium]MBI3425702.1 hypothetical protein [Acidobacteriota bacterium]
MKKLCLSAVISLFVFASLVSAQSVAGEWQATMETPGEPSVSKLTLTQDGEKLAGTLKGQRGEAQVQGTLKGKEVKFGYSINYNGNAVPITIAGLLDGDTIKGTASIASGAFEGAWMAKRMGAAATSPTAQASAANGNKWELTVTSPQGPRTSTLVYTLEGENLKGQLGSLPAQGTLKGSDITIKYTVKFQDNDLAITLTGKVTGDTMKGDADFGGLAQGDWTGKKLAGGAAASTAATPAASGAINLTGAWAVEVETSAGSGSPSFTFKQEGEKLTGHYKGQLGEADLAGTVKGGQLEFSYKLTGQVEGTVVYTGTTDGKTMKGKVSLAGLGEGTFSGKKQ